MDNARAVAMPSAGSRIRSFLGGRWIVAFLALETLYFAFTASGFASSETQAPGRR